MRLSDILSVMTSLDMSWYDDVTLRYDGEADGDPGDGVRHGVIQVVVRQPAQDGEAGLHTRHEAV